MEKNVLFTCDISIDGISGPIVKESFPFSGEIEMPNE